MRYLVYYEIADSDLIEVTDTAIRMGPRHPGA